MAASADWSGSPGGIRPSESAVSLLLIEHCQDYAALVCETLQRAPRGQFNIRSAEHFDTARCEVEEGRLDAVLIDVAASTDTEARRVRIDEASRLATRIPVIVLTGDDTEVAEGSEHTSESTVRQRIQSSPLPDEILRAVRRHRRLGPSGGADPIVIRDPMRACARLFARVRASLAG